MSRAHASRIDRKNASRSSAASLSPSSFRVSPLLAPAPAFVAFVAVAIAALWTWYA
jgi:hypothetical protein